MSGLAAFQTRGPLTAWSAVERARLAAAAQAHRGPDGEGLWWSAPGIHTGSQSALAHRRLAVIDPSAGGHQPRVDPATGHVLAFSGSLFNHRELREELGGEWDSSSDAETLLRAYARWGPACLPRLRGMFAFVLWDAAQCALWAARDRLGIQPLYLVEAPDGAGLASEARALLASGMVSPRLSRAGLAGYVRFGSVPEPATLLEGVRLVPAGHAVTLREGRVEAITRWWDLRQDVEQAGSPPAHEQALEHALENAVEEHLESDVSLGWLLDSPQIGVLMALAARGRGRGMPAFTPSWTGARKGELSAAAALAAHLGCAHEVVPVAAEQAVEGAKACAVACDRPTSDGLHAWLGAQALHARGVKVALCGLGGDELFGSQPSFRWAPRAERWAPVLGRLPAVLLRLCAGPSRGDRLADLLQPSIGLARRVDAVHALWPRRALQRALGPCVPCLPSLHQGAIPPAASGDWSPLAAVLALELEGALRPMALRDTEALGMAHALQVRIPLLDHRVVRAALQGARAGGEQAWIGKQAWRKLAARVVPAQALLPGVPHWKLAMARELRDPLAGFVAQGLDSLEQRRLLEGAFVRAVRGQAARGMRGWRRAWSLSALGHWVARHGVEDVAS